MYNPLFEGVESNFESQSSEDILDALSSAIEEIGKPTPPKKECIIVCGVGVAQDKKDIVKLIQRKLNTESPIYHYKLQEIDDIFIPLDNTLFVMKPDSEESI